MRMAWCSESHVIAQELEPYGRVVFLRTRRLVSLGIRDASEWRCKGSLQGIFPKKLPVIPSRRATSPPLWSAFDAEPTPWHLRRQRVSWKADEAGKIDRVCPVQGGLPV
jgi:hypothetical protein